MVRGIEAPVWSEAVMRVSDPQTAAIHSPQRLFVLMGMIYQDLRSGKMWGNGVVDCKAAWFRALAA